MTKSAKSAPRSMVLRLLDEAYDKATWHGCNLKSSVRGVTETEATWRPGRQRRNIAEIVVHCAYTKNLVRHRLTRTKRRDFPLRVYWASDSCAGIHGTIQHIGCQMLGRSGSFHDLGGAFFDCLDARITKSGAPSAYLPREKLVERRRVSMLRV